MPAKFKCYSGPNPIDRNDPEGLRRARIWKWARGEIDKGRSLEDLAEAINQKYYRGVGKHEWVMDVLSGSKTPYRQQALEVWGRNYNRRNVIREAESFSRRYAMSPAERALNASLEAPRAVSTFAHGVALSMTHPSDLLWSFSPMKWKAFFDGLRNTYSTQWGRGAAGRVGYLLATAERDPMYTLALRSGLEFGKNSHPTGIFSKIFGGEMGERAWQMLGLTRFNLWKSWMEKQMPKYGFAIDSPPQKLLEFGREGADWANHATGSAKLRIGKQAVPGASHLLFGPQLTGSKIARMVADPAKTLATFLNWSKATDAQKAVAKTRLAGAASFVAAYPTALAINQAFLSTFGSNQKINFLDPNQSDWWKFKAGGLEFGPPGIRTEVGLLSKIVYNAWREAHGADVAPWQTPFGTSKAPGGELGQWGLAKLSPQAGIIKDIALGVNFQGRKLDFIPWHFYESAKKPSMSLGEYAGTRAPIFSSSAIGYIFDQFREAGMSAPQAENMIQTLGKAGAMMALGYTGLEVKPEKEHEAQAQAQAPSPISSPHRGRPRKH